MKLWNEAISAELVTLKDKGTWSKISKPSANKNTLSSHIVLKIKRSKHGQVQKLKARVKAGGNHQFFMEDYEKIYVPVLNFTVYLLVLIICLIMRLSTCHADVKAAFLNGDIDRIIFISIFIAYYIQTSKKYIFYTSLFIA